MVRDRDGRRLWIQSEDGGFEPVRSQAGLVERRRGQGIPDWWVVAKDPDWTPAEGGHMKPNSSGQLQPYDNLDQYASPGGGSGSGTRGGGWTETSGQGRIRGTSLLSMGGGVLEEDAPEQPGPRRDQGRRQSLLFMNLNDEGEVRGEISESAVWGKAGTPHARIQEIERIAVPEPRAGEPPTQFSKVKLPGMSEPTMLDREFLDRLQEFDRLNQESGVAVTYQQGFRTTTKQRDIKSKPNSYPVAEPGKSLHEAGRAVDVNIAPFKNQEEKWNKVVGNAKKAGLSWGGDFSSKKDPVHFYLEVPGGIGKRREYIQRATTTDTRRK